MRLIQGSLVAFACLLSPRAGLTDDAKPKAAPAAPAPKSVKAETRPELEAEVERLRAENVSLRKEVSDLKAKEESRKKRLQDTLGGNTPVEKLK